MSADHVRATAPARVAVLAAAVLGVAAIGIGIVWIAAAISEVVLPLVLATMLAVVLYPLARRARQRGAAPALSSLGVLALLVAVGAGLIVVVVRTVVRETGELAGHLDEALDQLGGTTDAVGLDADALASLRASVRSVAEVVGRGLLTAFVGGVEATVGFVAGSVLGLTIAYYVLKDGTEIRRWLIERAPARDRREISDFVDGSVRSLRAYWAGRAVLAAIVAVTITVVCAVLGVPLLGTIGVVNFLGGFIPYLGAFVGGGLAALLALSSGGIGDALVVASAAVVANLVLENVLEPRVMGDRLAIHPLVVLVATASGGVVGGVIGLLVAVPLTAVAIDVVRRLRRHTRAAPPARAAAPADASLPVRS